MEEKIRLAVFGQKRLSREGGIEIVVKELCTRMAQNGCDVTCYNRAGHHVSGAEYDKTISIPPSRERRFCPKTASLIFSSITSLQPSFHSFYSCPRLIHNPTLCIRKNKCSEKEISS